jgi:hypothetical protein
MWVVIATSAAACALLLIALNRPSRTSMQDSSMAYIDGKQYTNITLVCTDAISALDAITEADETAISAQIEALTQLTIND